MHAWFAYLHDEAGSVHIATLYVRVERHLISFQKKGRYYDGMHSMMQTEAGKDLKLENPMHRVEYRLILSL